MRPIIKEFELVRSGKSFLKKINIELKFREGRAYQVEEIFMCKVSLIGRSMVSTTSSEKKRMVQNESRKLGSRSLAVHGLLNLIRIILYYPNRYGKL